MEQVLVSTLVGGNVEGMLDRGGRSCPRIFGAHRGCRGRPGILTAAEADIVGRVLTGSAVAEVKGRTSAWQGSSHRWVLANVVRRWWNTLVTAEM